MLNYYHRKTWPWVYYYILCINGRQAFIKFSGELKCCELVLRNIGPVSMKNVFLVCQTPGLVSFGKKINENDRLYEFPLIEDSGHHFRKQKEDGSIEQVLK